MVETRLIINVGYYFYSANLYSGRRSFKWIYELVIVVWSLVNINAASVIKLKIELVYATSWIHFHVKPLNIKLFVPILSPDFLAES